MKLSPEGLYFIGRAGYNFCCIDIYQIVVCLYNNNVILTDYHNDYLLNGVALFIV